MKTAIRDALYQLALSARKIRHRLRVKAKFRHPYDILSSCSRLKETGAKIVFLPEEFQNLSRSYPENCALKFPTEESYICAADRQISIYEGRFIHVDNNCYIDAGNQSRFPWLALEKPFESKPIEICETVIVPWGTGGASYGDFVIKLLPKLIRLLGLLSPEERHYTSICLPYFSGQPWAISYLSLLGIDKDRILDRSTTILIPPGGKLILGSGPQPSHGIAHINQVDLMLREFARAIPPISKNPWRRLYISRRSGRRMSNEQALLEGLRDRNFEIVCLEDLTLLDQISLFRESVIIVGPHGAGHANIIWALPNTQLLEIFHPSWMHPCYAIISQIIGVRYHCLVAHTGKGLGSWTERSRFGIFEDVSIEPEIFFSKIDAML